MWLAVHLCICLIIDPSVRSPVCMSFHMSVRPSVHYNTQVILYLELLIWYQIWTILGGCIIYESGRGWGSVWHRQMVVCVSVIWLYPRAIQYLLPEGPDDYSDSGFDHPWAGKCSRLLGNRYMAWQSGTVRIGTSYIYCNGPQPINATFLLYLCMLLRYTLLMNAV